MEPQRFWGWKVSRCGELNGAEPQQIKAAAPTLLTGRIETPQILRALLNFREMKVGGGGPERRRHRPK